MNGFATLLSAFDLDGFDDVSEETIAVICFVLAVNAIVIGLAVLAAEREGRIKVRP